MRRAEIISLVKETPSPHGVFETATETSRSVFCDIKSVGYNEFYSAQQAGIEPSVIFVLSDYSEYDGEKVIIWNNERYRVVRTYCKGQSLEITAEVATNDNS